MSDGRKLALSSREQLAYWLYDRGLLRFLPWRLVKHWLWPLSVRGRKVGFDARTYFGSWYASVGVEALSDRLTISPRTTEAQARFHYNVAENSILRYFSRREFPVNPRVLDIGSGAGHWIDFYLEVFAAAHVVGVDLVPACVEALKAKYSSDSRVAILEGDVSTREFSSRQEFDLVNAIGVMFHIVDDEAWRQALANISHS
jgi:SAM-dependent methyltransferase